MSPAEFNQQCIEKLKQYRFASRIAVIGSGLSCNLVDSIGELSNGMEESCGVTRKTDEIYAEFFDRAYKANPDQYFRRLRAAFENKSVRTAVAYWHIVKINFPGLITFNIDPQLPDVYASVMSEKKESVDFKAFPGQIYMPPELAGPKQKLVAAHGCVIPNEPDWTQKIILRKSEYDKHYGLAPGQPAPFLFTWWYWLLTTVPCVFIGTSLDELGLAHVIRRIHESKPGAAAFAQQQHIHLREAESIAPNYPSEGGFSLRCILRVLYDKVDDEHKGLRDVLFAFSNFRYGGTVPAEDRSFPLKDDLDFLKQDGERLT